MARDMKIVTITSCAAAVGTAIFYGFSHQGIFLTLAITFGTIFYHFGIRLLVGTIYSAKMKNRADYTKGWYQIHPWEHRVYRFFHVKSWKGKMPAYDPEKFSCKKYSWDEIAQVMCQSELVHETNIIVSFVPVIASRWFGAFWVFFVTSVGGAVFDLLFVMVQRYNRARIMKLALRQKKDSNAKRHPLKRDWM